MNVQVNWDPTETVYIVGSSSVDPLFLPVFESLPSLGGDPPPSTCVSL